MIRQRVPSPAALRTIRTHDGLTALVDEICLAHVPANVDLHCRHASGSWVRVVEVHRLDLLIANACGAGLAKAASSFRRNEMLLGTELGTRRNRREFAQGNRRVLTQAVKETEVVVENRGGIGGRRIG